MVSSHPTSPGTPVTAGAAREPNAAFRALRGARSPGEFAAAVRRAGREIGEKVGCDARYVGRIESGEIRCPNYAYERVFSHMFPGLSMTDLGFAPRTSVRGRAARVNGAGRARRAPAPPRPEPAGEVPEPLEELMSLAAPTAPRAFRLQQIDFDEESDVLRRAFMTGGPAALATASFAPPANAVPRPHRAPLRAAAAGESEVAAVEQAVRRIRLLDDRYGADTLYLRAGESLRTAQELLDAGVSSRRGLSGRLHSGAGELAISVGWLAHDSGRFEDARSHYAEALATARMAGDPALEAHAFCNTAFLARDAGRPREAVRAAQAGLQAAKGLGSSLLLSLLSLREAGGWAGLGDRAACEEAISRADAHFGRGAGDADPEWMSFFGEAELEGLQSQCWSALGRWGRAADHARRAVALQEPHFVRNRALFTAQLASDLAAGGRPDEAAGAANDTLVLLGPVRSARIRGMLAATARLLGGHRHRAPVGAFLSHPALGRS